jgi:hypothetical protein
MNHWLFFALQIISLIFCFIATRATVHYLAKHRVAPGKRYMLFHVIRTRHIALVYIISTFVVAAYSIIGQAVYTFDLL